RASSPKSHSWFISELSTEKFQDPICQDRKTAMIVEIRSTGCQTVVAPSIHPSGEVYEWSNKGEPAQVDPVDLRRSVRKLAACSLLARYSIDGKRHDLALALAGALLRAGWNEKDVEHFIVNAARVGGDAEIHDRKQAVKTTIKRLANGEKCWGIPKLRELLPNPIVDRFSDWLALGRETENRAVEDKQIQSADEWEKPATFYEHDLPDFPVPAFPEWLKQYVIGLARETQTPLDLPAMQSLTVCSGAVAGRVRIQARLGWIEPLNLYGVVTMPPGNRKSAVFAAACEPLEGLERELIEAKRDLIAEAASERRVLEERLARLEKDAARTEDQDERREKKKLATIVAQELAGTKVPAVPRLICADITPEALASLLAEQDGRMCLFSPEGDLFEMLAGRYTNAPNFDVILKGHCGDPLRVDRRGRSEHVHHPALTIGLCVQPDVIHGLVDKPGFRGRGLIGRFLYSLPVSTLGQRQIAPAPLSQSVRDRYTRSVKALAQLESARTAAGDPAPRMLYLTADADALLRQCEAELEPQLAEDGSLGMMSDWAGKLAGAIVRIAGILSLVDQVENLAPFPERVARDAMERAITIGQYLIPHARAAYAEMGADPQIENAKRLLRWIQKTGLRSFTKREAHQGNKGRFKKVADIEPALELLEQHGYIRAQADPSERGPGRKPSQVFDVNPYCFPSSHNSHNPHNSPSEHLNSNSENCETGELTDDDIIAAERNAIEQEEFVQ
ncbi:MAG TPA: DUF3987 domain-containing protein, partial [Pyrinomonadaceae bacterium]|nr:DUF3987 domain-containing protein [Pyrinomonadaceae bacterium]